jgi:Ni/Co efflux regulator RcnB
MSILLAGAAATPALAAPHNNDRDQTREEKSQAREEKSKAREEHQQAREQARPERPANVERRPVAPVQQPVAGQQRVQNVQAARGDRRQVIQESRAQRVDQLVAQRRDDRQVRQSTRATPHVLRNRVPVVSNVPRPGTQPPARVRPASQQTHWNTNWRHDNRYDWQNHRNHHRSLFHFGLYYDPFGWGYQPYQIGWRLWPSYYSSRYWINDPWQYRLPYAPAGTQWVRYYNDAVLVDTWSGQVVDVIYNFFW